ncbi:MAG: signal peptide peptidase SppA, partial [Muribaculaceae bacterium]|nr:signal peptide peptidase SppA [Muribaculaceae bacterium]
ATPAEPDYIRLLQGDLEVPLTLTDLTAAIREASDNDNIDMIYLKCGNIGGGMATLRALRQELLKFKDGGKKIYAYGDSYSLADYYVASVADSLFVNPDGVVAINGISGTVPYFKDLLDKVGVQMQVVKVGTFKSAVEPYITNEMSQPARAQLDTLYGNIWHDITAEIGKSRKISPAEINNIINNDFPQLKDAEFAVKKKLADKAVYERTMDARVANAVGVDVEKLNYVSNAGMTTMASANLNLGKKKRIAVLFATGEIMEGTKSGINCEVMVPIITGLADDDDVCGMVLRVNSPGGSVFGSEQIAEALAYFQQKGKPLAVSMGDYAASGGYWISCHANRIFADPLSITGSIGIFGMFPNAAELARKIGVNPQYVSTNPSADFPSLFRPMNETQLGAMQKMIEEGYDKFITRVATGRKMSKTKVESIAEGRVWDGRTALKLGLVDELGDLQAACDWVSNEVRKTKESDLGYEYLPTLDPGFWDMIRLAQQSEIRITMIKEVAKFVPEAEYALEVANVLRRRSIQARIVPMQTFYGGSQW